MPDPLFERLAPDALPEDLRKVRDASVERVGEGVRLEVFGHHPDVYRFYKQSFYGTIFEGRDGTMVVDVKWKELIRLKLSLTNGCFVCNASNVPAAMAAGFTQEQIDAMGDSNSPLFTAKEQAVLELGELMAIRETDPLLTPELYGKLSDHFSDAEILELGVVAAMLSGWTKLIFAFDLVTRECSINDMSRKATPSQVHIKAEALA